MSVGDYVWKDEGCEEPLALWFKKINRENFKCPRRCSVIKLLISFL